MFSARSTHAIHRQIGRLGIAAVLSVGIVAAAACSPESSSVPELGPTSATEVPDRVVLNPTATPATSQNITWRTAAGISDPVVEITRVGPGQADVGEPRIVAASERTRGLRSEVEHHSVTVDGLDPATTYRYRVGSMAGQWSPSYTFTTASSADDPWSFIYFGDAQNNLGDVWPQVAQQAYAHDPAASLSLHAGDLINNADRDEEWSQWFDAQGDDVATRNVIATPGNHEYKNDPNLTEYQAHFGFPKNGPITRGEDVWFTDYQGVRFVSLNANVLVGLDQILWMHWVLANNPNRWTVVTFHQPVFSGSSGRDNPGIRVAWAPIFEQYNVDLVLSGHDHVYARGHMMNRENADGTHSGPVYAVSVAGGKSYDLAEPHANVWTWNGARRQVAAQGLSTFQSIRIDGDSLSYESIVGRLSDAPLPGGLQVGDTLDAFTIDKAADGSKVITNDVPQLVADAVIPGVPWDPIGDLLSGLFK